MVFNLFAKGPAFSDLPGSAEVGGAAEVEVPPRSRCRKSLGAPDGRLRFADMLHSQEPI